MPVPGTQDIRRALLEILEEHPRSMTLKEWMSLAEKHLGVTVSINTQESKDFRDRIKESLQYLTDENMISNPSRYLYMITKKGKNVLDDKTENIDKELDTLPEELDLTNDEPETTEELDIADEKLDALPELDALPNDLDLSGDDTDTVPKNQEVSADADHIPELDALPDELDLTGDEADAVPETQKAPADADPTPELDALPDDLDLSSDDADTVPETQEAPADADQTPELDALPDDSDMTGDDADTIPENHGLSADADQTPELDALPDDLDMAGDESGTVPENHEAPADADPTPELDALPDELDLTSDDAESKDSDAQDEAIHEPESSEAASEDSGCQDLQQDTQINTDIDAENTIDSDTDTLNSIYEVDSDMPKDDLPADDFSTDTEDFSSAVNQALNIEDVFERHNTELADKVLMRAAGLSQEMFAVFVTDLLSKMGYNAFQTARYTSESEGNSMIQGVILDPKAKSPIYIHADKLSPGRTVGRSDMHDFADELAEKGGTGIFATTGDFSEQAGIYAQDERIMLIDGKKLAGLMLANNFCVNVAKVFEVKELDEDSFSEYE